MSVFSKIVELVFWKRTQAEKRRDRIVYLLGVRGDAISRLYVRKDDPGAAQRKFDAEVELKRLGVL